MSYFRYVGPVRVTTFRSCDWGNICGPPTHIVKGSSGNFYYTCDEHIPYDAQPPPDEDLPLDYEDQA